MLAIDTETFLVSAEEPVPRLVSIAVAEGDRHVLAKWNDPGVCDWIRHALRKPVAFANAPFDVNVIARQWPELWPVFVEAYQAGRILDVLTREKLIDIGHGHHFRLGPYNLGAVAERRAGLKVDKEDPWRTRYAELYTVPIEQWPAEARQYAINDAVSTSLVCERQEHYAHLLTDQGRQARAALALYAQTLRGIDTDPKMVERLDELLDLRWHEHAVLLVASGLARVQGKKKPKLVRNTKAAMALAEGWAEQHARPVKRTSRGISLAEEALEALRLPDGHPLYSYQQFGSVQALRNKNIAPLRAPIIRTRYDECIGTGRTASAAPSFECWSGTNVQNLPRSVAKPLGLTPEELEEKHGKIGFRECLVPPAGHAVVVSDWSMMELVCLAQVQLDWFGQSALADALNAGRDPHEDLGSAIAGFDIADHPERKRWRTLAKAPNFGYPGGLGAKRFCDFARGTYGIELTEAEARSLKRKWQQQWPEMRLYHERINNLPRDGNGKLIVKLDRTGFQRVGSFTEACNFPFQGLAAACAKDALWALWLSCRPGEQLEGCWQFIFVHDEIGTMAPIERAEEVREFQERVMVAAVARLCPDVRVGVESYIGDRYTK